MEHSIHDKLYEITYIDNWGDEKDCRLWAFDQSSAERMFINDDSKWNCKILFVTEIKI